MALVDMFLKLDGVEGESSDPDHKGEIQIEGFRLNLISPRDSFTTQPSGVRRWSHLSIRASVDMSTPLLFQKLATNSKIPKAVLTCRKAGKKPVDFLKVTLNEVLVVKVQTGDLEAGKGDVVPPCDFDLAYGKIEIVASPQTSLGTSGGQNMMMDNLMANT
jgi:type VI secretion system secreted protein Hcp